jgi:peptidoglycan biosynthesis protein MviN/MurJ (putative lipid II flippase)
MLFWLRRDGAFQNYMFAFLDLFDVPHREIIALPFGTSIGACINFLFLHSALLRHRKEVFLQSTKFFLQVSCIAAISGLIGWVSIRATLNFLDFTTFFGIFIHGTIGGAITLTIFIILASFLRIEEIKNLRSFLRLRAGTRDHMQKDTNVLE